MTAVIRTGGKQYRVSADDVIKVEKLAGDAGDQVIFDQVLALDGTIGTPLVDGASVAGRVIAQDRAEKIIVFKKKRRQNYRRRKGHRQHLTVVRIEEILTGGKKPSGKAAKKPAPKKADADKSDKDDAAEKKPAKEAAKQEAPEKEAAEKPAAKADGPRFTAPDGAKDDLKKIGGVGPKLEEKLNALGITTYAQVAAFTKEDIAYVDDELNFKGRIDRDNWVDQAKDLAAGKDD